MGTVETKAVSAGQEQWVLKELQTNWTGQLRLQCFHLQAKQSGVVSEIQGSWWAICKETGKWVIKWWWLWKEWGLYLQLRMIEYYLQLFLVQKIPNIPASAWQLWGFSSYVISTQKKVFKHIILSFRKLSQASFFVLLSFNTELKWLIDQI